MHYTHRVLAILTLAFSLLQASSTCTPHAEPNLPIITFTEQAHALFAASQKAQQEIMALPEQRKLFRTFNQLIDLMRRKNYGSEAGQKLKPGAINLMVKYAARGLGKSFAIWGKHLDTQSAALVRTLMLNAQQALIHLERFVQSATTEEKELIGKHVGCIVQELLAIIDIKATGKNYLEFVRKVIETIPHIKDELLKGTLSNSGQKPARIKLEPRELQNSWESELLTPETFNIFLAIASYMHEWDTSEVPEMIETAIALAPSHEELLVDILDLIPVVAYNVGTYLTQEECVTITHALDKLHTVAVEAEKAISSGDSTSVCAGLGQLVQFLCMQLKLPTLPKQCPALITACNQHFPLILQQFDASVTRAKR